MKPTKDNLIDEIKYRIESLESEINKTDDAFLLSIFNNELSMNKEVLSLIEIFENRIGFEKFELSKYTPIKCNQTKEPLKIGDYVENYNGQCGTLQFEEIFNKYVIKTESGGNVYSQVFVKIEKPYDYKIDNTRVECRATPNKKRW